MTLFLLFWVPLMLVLIWYLLMFLVKFLADKDILWTNMPEPGHFKFLMKGGDLVRIIDNVPGWKLNSAGLFERGVRGKSLSELSFGTFFMGFNPNKHIKVFKDMEWT